MDDAGYESFRFETLDGKGLIHRTVDTRRRPLVYRGVKNSEYKLLASAFRDGGKKDLWRLAETYIKNNSSGPTDNLELSQEETEICALLWFYELANQQGIEVPDIPHAYKGDPLLEVRELMSQFELVDEWLEVRALAQHYGIPTRMLDWTFDMNAAIYFAVQGVSDKDIDKFPDMKVSIWELDRSKLALICPYVSFVVPKYSGNPNLRAQSGILSQIKPVFGIEDQSLEVLVEAWSDPGYCGAYDEISRDGEPVLRRLDVPYNEVPYIRESLESRGLWHDHYFPGLQGVVDAMKRSSRI